jgi:hypothetical protein
MKFVIIIALLSTTLACAKAHIRECKPDVLRNTGNMEPNQWYYYCKHVTRDVYAYASDDFTCPTNYRLLPRDQILPSNAVFEKLIRYCKHDWGEVYVLANTTRLVCPRNYTLQPANFTLPPDKMALGQDPTSCCTGDCGLCGGLCDGSCCTNNCGCSSCECQGICIVAVIAARDVFSFATAGTGPAALAAVCSLSGCPLS